jgi:hypothetical protein
VRRAAARAGLRVVLAGAMVLLLLICVRIAGVPG